MNCIRQIALSAALVISCSLAAQDSTPASTSSPATMNVDRKPYAPLMDFGTAPHSEKLTEQQIHWMANTWQFVNSVSIESEKEIRKYNPNFISSYYVNGSYTAGSEESTDVEKRLPLAIRVWNSGCKLTQPLDEKTTSITMTSATEKHAASQATAGDTENVVSTGPKNAPPIYPWKASKTKDVYSLDNQKYVAWLRLGDEILRIDEVSASNGQIAMKVQRGIWGTKPAAHDVNTPVLQPVYIGAVTQGTDSAFTGVPDAKNKGNRLRYAMQVQSKDFQKWLGDKCEPIFKQGGRVIWMDITSSNFYNNANYYAAAVTPWNIEAGKVMDTITQREFQQQKMDYLLKRFPKYQFIINNVKPGNYFGKGQEKRFLSGEGGYVPVSGACIENYAEDRTEEDWQNTIDVSLDMVKNNYWTMALSKGLNLPAEKRKEYRLFAYGTYLLTYEPNCRMLFGAFWEKGPLTQPADYFYYELGKPEQHFTKHTEAADANVKGLYERQYENGMVFVNPTDKPLKKTLESPMLNPETKQMVNEVEVPARGARILMKAK